jgi:serine/threonine-protein kinase RsbW
MTMRFTIPSDYACSREVQQKVMDEVEKHHYCDAASFAIRLALEEAIVNAIKHGNRLDPARKVIIEADVTDQRTVLSVEDEGPGFERGHVPDPRNPENLTKASGRGILLIEAYMHEVTWLNNGRRLTMCRRNEPDAPAMGCP